MWMCVYIYMTGSTWNPVMTKLNQVRMTLHEPS